MNNTQKGQHAKPEGDASKRKRLKRAVGIGAGVLAVALVVVGVTVFTFNSSTLSSTTGVFNQIKDSQNTSNERGDVSEEGKSGGKGEIVTLAPATAGGSMAGFDVNRNVIYTDYILSGTIVSIDELIVGSSGSSPSKKTSLVLNVGTVYYGDLASESPPLSAHCSFSIDDIGANQFLIEEGREYLFLGHAYTQEEIAMVVGTEYEDTYGKADMALGNQWVSVIPIENNMVVASELYSVYATPVEVNTLEQAKQIMPFSFALMNDSMRNPQGSVKIYRLDDFISAFVQLENEIR